MQLNMYTSLEKSSAKWHN